MDEPTPPPQKLPPWVKKEILLPVIGVFLVGSIFGNYLVYRAIKKEGKLGATRYGPMDQRPLPANSPLSQIVVNTGREFTETNGIVRFDATGFTRLTGAWQATKDDGRNVMRMNGRDVLASSGGHRYLAYRIHFTMPGRYRLRGLMRSTGAPAIDRVLVFWNREPARGNAEDYELKIESTNYVWSAGFRDRTSDESDAQEPKNRDFAENGFPVTVPGPFTLYIATSAEPVPTGQASVSDADFFAVDQFELRKVDLGDAPPN